MKSSSTLRRGSPEFPRSPLNSLLRSRSLWSFGRSPMAGTDTLVLNQEIIKLLNIDEASIDAAITRERTELERRNKLYRRGMPAPDIQGKTIILVDDGLATGATMRAAIVSLHDAGAARIVVAVPVGTTSACRKIRQEADDLVCLYTPEPFFGVGQWYDNFVQTPDEEVLASCSITSIKW